MCGFKRTGDILASSEPVQSCGSMRIRGWLFDKKDAPTDSIQVICDRTVMHARYDEPLRWVVFAAVDRKQQKSSKAVIETGLDRAAVHWFALQYTCS